MNHPSRLLTIGVFLLFSIANGARAVSFVPYLDRQQWEDAVGIFSIDDFESAQPEGASLNGHTFELKQFSILIEENHGDISIGSAGKIAGSQGFLGDVHGDSSLPTSNSILFSQGIRSFAADFGDIDEGGLAVDIAGMTFKLANGTSFFGVTADMPFSLIDIRAASFPTTEFYQLDNVSYAVPEPSTLALTSLGLLGMGWLRRRSDRNSRGPARVET